MRAVRRFFEKVKNDEGAARMWAVIGSVAAVMAIPLAVLAIIIPLVISPDKREVSTSTTSPSTSPLPTTAQSDQSNAQPSETIAATGSTDSPLGDRSAPIPLTLSDAVKLQSCEAGWSTNNAVIGGVDYPESFGIGCYANVGTADFAVPGGVKRLLGTVGIDDRSPHESARVIFSVLDMAGKTLANRTLSLGDSWQLDVSLEDTVRIRLHVQTSLQERQGEWVTAAWADMKFTQ
jgi:hypothetical protein